MSNWAEDKLNIAKELATRAGQKLDALDSLKFASEILNGAKADANRAQIELDRSNDRLASAINLFDAKEKEAREFIDKLKGAKS